MVDVDKWLDTRERAFSGGHSGFAFVYTLHGAILVEIKQNTRLFECDNVVDNTKPVEDFIDPVLKRERALQQKKNVERSYF